LALVLQTVLRVHNSGKATEVDFPRISVLQACRTFSVHFREIADFSAKSTEQRQPGLPPGLLFLTFFLRYLPCTKETQIVKKQLEWIGSCGIWGCCGVELRSTVLQ
jgi:hypothetical protein